MTVKRRSFWQKLSGVPEVAEVYLMRHGDRDLPGEGMSARGRDQVMGSGKRLAAELANTHPAIPVDIWTSPAPRCQETAALVHDELRCADLPVGSITIKPWLGLDPIGVPADRLERALPRDVRAAADRLVLLVTHEPIITRFTKVVMPLAGFCRADIELINA